MKLRNPEGLRAVLIALFLFLTLPLAAQEPEPQPFARTLLKPGPRVTVGQPLSVVVEVLVPSWFTAAPWFPTVDVADAIAVYEDRGTNFTERIDGRTWAGQSRSYQVYPQRPGSFEIAEIPVRVRYLSETTGPRTQVTVSPSPVRFEATVPPGAEELPYFIGATSLTVEQSFDREPTTLKVGEAFTRTVTVTVNGALAMVERANGNRAGAIKAYVEGVRADDMDPWTWAGMGDAVLELGDPGGAVSAFRNAAILAPGWDAVDEALATALFVSDRASEVRREFEARDRWGKGAAARAALVVATLLETGQAPAEQDERVRSALDGLLQRIGQAGGLELLSRLATLRSRS